MKKPMKPRRSRFTPPKECVLCTEKKEPSITDIETLRRFISDRGKIIGQARSGLCAKHQRGLTRAIKHARHLALLPFVGQP